MEVFTQKWAIVSLLEHAAEGVEFHYSDFPLHVTLAGVFEIDKDEAWLAKGLSDILSNQSPVEIQADEKAMFGPNEDVAVMKLDKSAALINLYQIVYQWLDAAGARYNQPAYQGNGYAPHSTFQKTGALAPGEKRLLRSVSLVDLYPHQNGYQRKLSRTFELF